VSHGGGTGDSHTGTDPAGGVVHAARLWRPGSEDIATLAMRTPSGTGNIGAHTRCPGGLAACPQRGARLVSVPAETRARQDGHMITPLTDISDRPDLTLVAGLLAGRSRAAVLMALHDGRALPAGRLAVEAGVTASTISGHLRQLVEGGLLDVETSGRHRYYRLSRPEVGDLLEVLVALSPCPERPRSMRAAGRMRRLRRARTCYDHCAGELGTALLRWLVASQALLRTDGMEGTGRALADRLSAPVVAAPYDWGPEAEPVFDAWGVDLARVRAGNRPAIRVCVDWTEQAHHLAGGLGAAVLQRFVEMDWVRRTERPRELEVTDVGAGQLGDVLAPA